MNFLHNETTQHNQSTFSNSKHELSILLMNFIILWFYQFDRTSKTTLKTDLDEHITK